MPLLPPGGTLNSIFRLKSMNSRSVRRLPKREYGEKSSFSVVLTNSPSTALQPLICLGLVSSQPSRLRPLNSLKGFPNSTLLKSGFGGIGGIRLPVNGTSSIIPPLTCPCWANLRASPSTFAV